ncbi:MAG: helix-turn-helix transcriptional regulator [Alphaproteobacteria bacterium]|nr:helix-turn-helix transcriptional regulator [Alphaproteobacteria bacterium]
MFDFGANLKEIRKNRKLTQKKLAEKINVTESTICRYEANTLTPSYEGLISLAAVLNVPIEYLFSSERKSSVSTYGLSDTQAEIIKNLTDMFRDSRSSLSKQITPEQCIVLGQIVAEFSK